MNRSRHSSLLVCLLAIFILMFALFHRLLLPGVVVFSNDMPYGFIAAEYSQVPAAISGSWQDLNWLGIELPGLAPAFATTLRLLSSAEWFSKIHAPAALAFLGMCAWIFFRRAGLAPAAALLGVLATMLNSSALSSACWGVVGYVLTWAWCFLALSLLWPWNGPRVWIRTMLSGFCLGMAIMDGIDVAALFSPLIAAVVMFGEWLQPGPAVKRLLRGAIRTATVAICSALISAHALSSLISTQVQGVGVLQEEQRSRAEQWSWATQWSLPKAETLGLAVPGLFGNRMDTPDGGNYWGSLGRDPRLDDWFASGRAGSPPPNSGFRFSGGGAYAGALVLLVAFWAFHRSLRTGDATALATGGRRWVWFWTAAALTGLLLAWGRFAPFYQMVFAIPGVSSIRNPVKFIHIANFSMVILFAYGVDGLLRLGQTSLAAAKDKPQASLGRLWQRARGADRRFAWLLLGLLGVLGLGSILYAASRPDLEKYLQSVQFDPTLAAAIAKFSISAAGWAFVRYVVAGVAVLLLLSGWLGGARSRWGVALLGAVLLVDLIPANRPWIVWVDVPKKYAQDSVVDVLKAFGPEARVAILPFGGPSNPGLLSSVYGLEWAQHHFQAENIQSLDVVQMPRPPADRLPFELALQPAGDLASLPVMARRWELTSTRHLIGPVQFQLPWGVDDGVSFLNRALDPERHRFRVMERFALVAKPWVTRAEKYEDFHAVLATNGPYAVYEFAGALPKAGLYSHWQVETNDEVTLKTIADRGFDPQATVMVAGGIEPPAADAPTNSVTPVEFVSYSPKGIQLRARAETPAVLLLNDRYDSDWTVSVDGEPARLLQCNFIMRGVHLQPGEHTIQFTLRPNITGLHISLITMGVAVLLLGVLALGGRRTSSNTGSDFLEDNRPVKAPSGDPGKTRKA